MMRTCELCGTAFDSPTIKVCPGPSQFGGNSCGGTILPAPVAAKPKNKAEEKTIITFEPRAECLVCQDTGHVGIVTPNGIEIWNCARGCKPLVIEVEAKRLA